MRQLLRNTKLAAAMSAALIGGGFATSSSANVSLTVDGFGDAGLFQYYTVKGDPNWQTFFRIFNNSDQAIAVKVRFREGANSREVLDFVVWLSPNDAWEAWTDTNASGLTGRGAGIRTRDMSCTTPGPIAGSPTETFGWLENDIRTGIRYAEFKDSAITAPYDDGTTLSAAERAMEGHVEVIGIAAWDKGTAVYDSVLHEIDPATGDSVPSCTGLEDFAFGAPYGNLTGESATAQDVPNVLAMNAYVVRLSTGQGAGYDPVMFANFSTEDGDAQRMIWEQVYDAQKPDLDSGDQMSWVTDVDVDPQTVYDDTWDGALPVGGTARQTARENVTGPNGWLLGTVRGGIDAVSATLTRTAVVNEWIRRPQALDPDAFLINIFSQWVMTLPTKNYYVDSFADPIETLAPFRTDNIYPTLDCTGGACPNNAPYAPFSSIYSSESCDSYRLTLWNSEEQGRTYTSPVPSYLGDLCHEVQVLEFGASTSAMGSYPLGLDSNYPIEISEVLFPPNPRFSTEPELAQADSGWARLEFWDSEAATTGLVGTNRAYYGLPVTGFMFSLYETSDPGSNAAMISSHKYERDSDPVQTGP